MKWVDRAGRHAPLRQHSRRNGRRHVLPPSGSRKCWARPCNGAQRSDRVARRIVAKLFGSAQAVSPEVSDALAELAKLAKEHPELAGPRALLSEILPRLFQEPNEE